MRIAKKIQLYIYRLFFKPKVKDEDEAILIDVIPDGLSREYSYDEINPNDPSWLKLAFGELGQVETKGKGNNPRIIEYHQMTTLKATQDSVPWCASFVCWVLEMSGIRSTRSAAAKSYLNWGYKSGMRTRGDIVIFNRPPNPASGHVGFYLGETDSFIYVLGGNQSNSVSIARYSKRNFIEARTWIDG